ncbi:MAG TPA: SDR family NAD(P)-dependent oxidoreductase [Kribbella sp.]|uniref:SDR family NAD(P)-dependent oxidoreductase n=1 Tax=Kribbella sp. TaxID=1871183 RepID=UPI002D775119|nr:SDR family NAD(P)-dependent oxidoreductase [Kribbella sp.]HET6294920.1 SDR family NAD(P)-dependent oxidoreductase [Kribbella sp.]
MELDGKVVLVTGASSGIGRAVSVSLAAAGAKLVVHGRDVARTRDAAEQVNGAAVVADLGDPLGVPALAEQALAAHGRVDVLIASAGHGWSGPFVDMSDQEISELVTVDLLAALRLTRLLLPGMIERGTGYVFLVTSVAGRTGVAGEAVYAAAKAGLDAFAESLRLELAGTGVQVGVVVPSAVSTDFFSTRGRAYDRSVPRAVGPEVVAHAIVRAIEQDRAEIWVPRWVRIGSVVRAVSPAAYRRLATRYGEPIRSTPPPSDQPQSTPPRADEPRSDQPRSDEPQAGAGVVLPSSDAFFLHVENAGAPQHVGGVVVFEPTTDNEALSVERVREIVRGELERLPRFRQRLAPTARWRRPRWVDVAEIDWHLHVSERRSPNGDAGLRQIVAELAESPMPRDRPLWRIVMVRDVSPGQSAMILLLHHAVADGIGTVIQVLNLLRPRIELPTANGQAPSRRQLTMATIAGLAQLATDGGAGGGFADASRRREFATADLDLTAVRRAATARGVRVTDLVISLVAEAVATTHPEAARRIGGRLRVAVPLMVRDSSAAAEMNATAAVMVDAPVDARPIENLLTEVARRTKRLRTPTRAVASRFVMATGLRALPEPSAGWFARTVYGRRFFHAIVSNMPGSTEPLSMDGVTIASVYPILPLAPGSPITVGALSWAGTLGIGLATDPLLFDAESLALRMKLALDELI